MKSSTFGTLLFYPLLMHRLLVILSFLSLVYQSMAQDVLSNAPYEKEWAAIDSLLDQQLPQSALEQVNLLQQKALSDNQNSHELKTLLYQSQISARLEDGGSWKALLQLQERYETTSNAVDKAWLASILAQRFHEYFLQNNYAIRNRTTTANIPTEDENTWSAADFTAKITEFFLASMATTDTRDVQLASFSPLIVSGKLSADFRPTLYDLLLHRAIEYFSTNDAFLNEPSYQSSLDNLDLLLPLDEFLQVNWSADTKGTSTRLLLELLQEALRWRKQFADKKALVDLDLQRLRMLYDHLQLEGREAAYFAALEQWLSQLADTPDERMPLLEQIQYLYEEGQLYNLDEEEEVSRRWYLAQAIEKCQYLIKQYPDSYEASQARYWEQQILIPSLQVQVEAVQLPEQAGLVHITYKNIAQLYFRILPLGEEDYLKRGDDPKMLRRLIKGKPLQAWDVQLPNAGDYLDHSTETYFKGLKRGLYSLAISDDSSFEIKGDATTFIHFWVSDIGALTGQSKEGYPQFLAVSRSTGKPLTGATINVWGAATYNSTDFRKLVQLQTDKLGMATVTTGLDTRRNRIEVITDNDHLFTTENVYLSNRRPQAFLAQQTVQFFTDRSIYRPGQTVFFKCLVSTIENAESYPEIMANRPLDVTLEDANGQEVATLSLRTNGFGTASGEFTIPKGLRLGYMTLVAPNSRHSIRVEEYKRPRFYAEIDNPKDGIRLGDSVVLEGKALAYAGPAIAGATVRYTVQRRINFPWWGRYFTAFPKTLTSGETTTDSDGQFKISFLAKAAANATSDVYPIYTFEVKADVIDETGEARNTTKSVVITKYPFQLDVQPLGNPSIGSTMDLRLSSKNLSGEAISCKATLVIEHRSNVQPFQIKRYWGHPDTMLLSQKNYQRLFPQYSYDNPADAEKDAIWRTIHQVDLTLTGIDTIQLKTEDWPVGDYRFKLQTPTDDGENLEVAHRKTLHNWTSGELATAEPIELYVAKNSAEPGDKVTLKIGTPLPEQVGTLVALDRPGHERQRLWYRPQPIDEVVIPITEEDRGNVFVHYRWFYANRTRSAQKIIFVPYSNKQLEVSYERLRSKLQPGVPEEWTVKISTKDQAAYPVELLASMYDASLDQLSPHQWRYSPIPYRYSHPRWSAQYYNDLGVYPNRTADIKLVSPIERVYPRLFDISSFRPMLRGISAEYMMADAPMAFSASEPSTKMAKADMATGGRGNANDETTGSVGEEQDSPAPAIRTNLKETAFFFPHLTSEEDGTIQIKFTSPEALTTWKLQLLATSPELAFALDTKEVITQKDLMILPNFPRFVRTGDTITLTAKVSNLSPSSQRVTAKLELFDLQTESALNQLLTSSATLPLSVGENASETVRWTLSIPDDFTGVIAYRVSVSGEQLTDGEEGFFPVLSNHILVTDTEPIFVPGKSKRSFQLERLADAKPGTQHHRLTFDMTTNPVWEAVKALPYLQEYPYDCTEQLINKWFANSLSVHIAQANPSLQQLYTSWMNNESSTQSPLITNEVLSSAVLAETPWVAQAKAEQTQRQQISKLFDQEARQEEAATSLRKISARQNNDGGFSWFPDGRSSWFITQYVLEQYFKLYTLIGKEISFPDWVNRAINYTDQQAAERYDRLVQDKQLEGDQFEPLIAQYLYTRSSALQVPLREDWAKMYNYWIQQAADHWTGQSLQTQAHAAIALHRTNQGTAAQRIFQSVQERSRFQEDLGRYWPQQQGGFYWYEHPLETQSTLLELYQLFDAPTTTIDELRLWLLRNKETNRWETTKATAAAVYALLHTGTDWQAEGKPLQVSMPLATVTTQIKISEAQRTAEAGTGYFSASWDKEQINADLATVEIHNKNQAPSWGGLYWQYFSTIEDIQAATNTPLQVERQLYKRIYTDNGELLEPLTDVASVGDLISVRLVVRTDRDMEFVHLKDLRASGLEPTEAISKYQYQGGLGYYQSSTDIATNFFFDYLPKGEYVLEYNLRVFHAGDFSGGMTTLQCMYAPKFSSRSAGERLQVK